MQFSDIRTMQWNSRLAKIPRFGCRNAKSFVLGLKRALCSALLLAVCGIAHARADAPAMVVPGQFNVGATGAFTYTIPVVTPPGTAGMTPALSLDYSSQNGDGLEGLGWVMSGLPSITRCPRTIAQDGIHGGVNYDAGDQFCMEGQRLIKGAASSLCAGGILYDTEIEGFSRIVACGTAGVGPAYFKVWTKSGQVMEFGNTVDSKAPLVAVTGSTTGPAGTVRAWAVNKISDTVGNYLTIIYDNGTPDTTYGQVYPTEIDYTGNASATPHLTPYNSVKFTYMPRSDLIASYQAGALSEPALLLTHIKTYVGATSPVIVSDYRLSYNYASPGGGHNELANVTLCDSDGSGAHCLTPTTFTWQGSRDRLTMTGTPNGLAQGRTPSKPNNTTADFNGDGLSDVVVLQNEGTNCPVANGSVFFGGQDGLTYTASGMTATYNPPHGPGNNSDCNGLTTFYNGLTTLFDYDGDGITDVIEEDNDVDNENHYYVLHEDTPTSFATVSPSNYLYFLDTGGAPIIGDFNGDGRTDILDQRPTGSSYSYMMLSDGTGNFNIDTADPVKYGVDDDDSFLFTGDFDGDGCTDLLVQNAKVTASNGVVYFCNPAVKNIAAPQGDWLKPGYVLTFGDFNGDGKTDILRTQNDQTPILYLSTGTGFVQVPWDPVLGQSYADFNIVTGDFNGDGKTDIAFIAKCYFQNCGSGALTGPHLIFLSTGAGFVPATDSQGHAVTIPNTNYLDDNSGSMAAVAADWNNDGASDLWLQKATGDTEYLFTFTPELIRVVNNGLGPIVQSVAAGVTTTVTYDRINRNQPLYTKCPNNPASYVCGDFYPTQGIDGPLYVVSRVDSSNGQGICAPPSTANCYSSSYAYAGAKANMFGRGFLGFSSVTVTDLQTHIVQTTTYNTAFPYTGMIATQTKVCPQPTCLATQSVTLSSAANTYSGNGQCTSATPVGPVYTIYLCSTVVASNDADGSAMQTVETDYANYDAYGNAQTVAVKTTPPGGSAPDAVKTTTSVYSNDTTNWFLGRLTSATVEATYSDGYLATDLTRSTSFAYDPGTGLLTKEIVEPGFVNTSLWSETDYGYDSYGNKTSVTVLGCPDNSNPCTPVSRGATTKYYDATLDPTAQFPVMSTNALGQSETRTFNTSFGVALSQTGPNNLTTRWGYDTFGRKTQETGPDGTQTTITYSYCSGVNGGTDTNCPANAQFSVDTATTGAGAQIAPNTYAYYDMLSRNVVSDAQGFDGSLVRTDTFYDTFGRVAQKDRPYFLQNLAAGKAPCAANSNTYCSTFAYDALGRVKTMTAADGSVTNNIYDGLTDSVSNAKHQVTTTLKNDLGMPQTVTDAAGSVTTYHYDAYGNTRVVIDPSGNQTTNLYAVPGLADTTALRKTQSVDPDMGTWTYAYDSFGELVRQVDPKESANGTASTSAYDVLGRMISRTEPDMVSTWTYGTTAASHNVGKLITETCAAGASGNACASTGYSRAYQYDGLSRQSRLTVTLGTANYFTTTAYDTGSGKITDTRAFSGLTLHYHYNGRGYQDEIDNGTNYAIVYWQANARDAELHLTQTTAGNGVVTSNGFDPKTGRPLSICATNDTLTPCDGNIANLAYGWDVLGNLTSRSDMLAVSGGLSEASIYDALNRLTNAVVTVGSVSTPHGVSYDALGDITKKVGLCSFVGCLTYGNTAHVHAVTNVSTSSGVTYVGLTHPNFYYDADGNLLCVTSVTSCNAATDAESVSWTSSNMVSTVKQGTAASLAFAYTPEHQRVTQVSTNGGLTVTTSYFNDPASNVMTESTHQTGLNKWKTYVVADGHIVGQYVTSSGTNAPPTDVKFFVLDHLGSVAVITDGVVGSPTYGTVVERKFYDAWGKQRNADGTPDNSCALPPASQTTRGFTNQEEMPSVCLVNLNARIYDPALGRFLSADPTTESPYDLQDLNRYSYVGNNPLSFTDPSGLCFLGCFWRNDLVRAGLAIVAAIVAQYELVAIEGSAFAGSSLGITVNGGVAGGISGYVSSGKLNGAMMGALEGVAFAGVHIAKADMGFPGDPGGYSTGQVIASAGMHGMVGGLFSLAHGKFASGFLSAGLADLAGDGDSQEVNAEDALKHAIVGGLGSVLGGGKFANGAITGAFGYLFNNCGHAGLCHQTQKDVLAAQAEYRACDDAADVGACQDTAKSDFFEAGGNAFGQGADPWFGNPHFTIGVVGLGGPLAGTAGAICVATGICPLALDAVTSTAGQLAQTSGKQLAIVVFSGYARFVQPTIEAIETGTPKYEELIEEFFETKPPPPAPPGWSAPPPKL
jgi:RHS repeat-associated protein